jgi:hypothetical protein
MSPSNGLRYWAVQAGCVILVAIALVAGLTADSPLTTALADLEHLDIPLVVER